MLKSTKLFRTHIKRGVVNTLLISTCFGIIPFISQAYAAVEQPPVASPTSCPSIDCAAPPDNCSWVGMNACTQTCGKLVCGGPTPTPACVPMPPQCNQPNNPPCHIPPGGWCPLNQLPIVAISGGQPTLLKGQQYTWTDSSKDPDGQITSYAWSGSNAVPASSNTSKYSPFFTAAGRQTVTHTITDTVGASKSTSVNAFIQDQPPKALSIASVSLQGSPQNPIPKRGTGVWRATATDPDVNSNYQDQLEYSWRIIGANGYGDWSNWEKGTWSGGVNIDTFYASYLFPSGTYKIQYRVRDSDQVTSSLSDICIDNVNCQQFSISNTPPVCDNITLSNTVIYVGETMNATGYSHDDNADTLTYAWRIDNGVTTPTPASGTTTTEINPSTGLPRQVSHYTGSITRQFTSQGSHTIDLTVTDEDNASHTCPQQTITVIARSWFEGLGADIYAGENIAINQKPYPLTPNTFNANWIVETGKTIDQKFLIQGHPLAWRSPGYLPNTPSQSQYGFDYYQKLFAIPQDRYFTGITIHQWISNSPGTVQGVRTESEQGKVLQSVLPTLIPTPFCITMPPQCTQPNNPPCHLPPGGWCPSITPVLSRSDGPVVQTTPGRNVTLNVDDANSFPDGSTILIPADLTIAKDFTPASGRFVVIIVKGDVTFSPDVKQFNGVIVADGTISTGTHVDKNQDKSLIINGQLIANKIILERSVDDGGVGVNTTVSEQAKADSEIFFKLSNLIGISSTYWQEIAP